LADLIPSNPNAQASDERYPVTACTGFLNVGKAPTATAFRVRLDIDAIPTGERQFTKAYQQGEGEGDICWGNLTLVGGRHTMTIIVDSSGEAPESDEGNNERSTTFTVRPTPQVDLTVSGFIVTPYEGVPRSNQLFVVNVTNVGLEVSAPTIVNISDDNGVLASLPLAALKPHEMRQVAHATRPEFRPVGTFIARAVVDPQGANAEVSELNNEAFLEYVVLEHPAPDLVITNVTITGNHTEFRGLKAIVTVKNIGDQLVHGNLVRALNESDVIVQEARTLGILYPDQSGKVQLNLILRSGERTIRFIADPYQLALEKNESNNVWAEAITILPHPVLLDEPNLVIDRIYAMPSDPRPGEAVSVGALIRNVGTNKSRETFVNFSVDGTPIGSAKVPSLKPEASYAAYVPWVVRTEGTHSILAAADGTNVEQELDEDDNALGLDFLVTTLPVPDSGAPAANTTTNTTEPPPSNVTDTTQPPVRPPSTNTTAPRNVTGPRVALADLVIDTHPVPGGVKGVVSASLRNPNIQPVGLLSVTFKVDGELIREVLVNGLRGAATESATTGEVDLPEGKHTITAEVRVVNSQERPLLREKEYDQAAGKKTGIPGFELPAALLAGVAIAVLSKRRRV
jgi:hypothetical protein